MKRTDRRATETMITELARAIYRDQTMQPRFKWSDRQLTIDIGDRDPGILIGGRGSVKFAIQNLVAWQANRHPEAQRIHIASHGAQERVKSSPEQPPDTTKLQRWFDAVCALLGGKGTLEQSTTMVHGRIVVPSDTISRLATHLHRLFRIAGKSNGFGATLYLEPPA